MGVKMTIGPFEPERGYGLVSVGDQFKQAHSWNEVKRIAAKAGADMTTEITCHSPSSYPDLSGR
jgi:hypothetical protein